MNVSKVESSVIVQTWRDVESVSEFTQKYGLSGVDYVETPDFAVPGYEVTQGGTYVAPPTPTISVVDWREDAFLTKQMFCLGLVDLGILTMPETDQLVSGIWPALFIPAINSTPDPIRTHAIWNTATIVNRNDGLVLMLQAYSISAGTFPPLTDALVDELFGWTP